MGLLAIINRFPESADSWLDNEADLCTVGIKEVLNSGLELMNLRLCGLEY
jgi:hypothetical protein